MQSTSIATKRVVWREGTLLRPQHFQQQQLHFESQAQLRSALLCPYGWGVGSMDIDEERLLQGEFSLRFITAIFPNGRLVRLGPAELEQSQLSILSYFERGQNEALVHVALAQPEQDPQASTQGSVQNHFGQYQSSFFDIEDHCSPGQRADIELAWPRIRLLIEDEAHKQSNVLPIAKILRQDKGYVLDPSFIPPSLNLHAGSGLDIAVRALLAKGAQRLEDLKRARSLQDTQQLRFEPEDLQRHLWISSLSGSMAAIEAMLLGQGSSPYTLYLELQRWAGQLASLQLRSPAKSSQGYIHLRAHACFQPLFEQLFDLLDQCVIDEYQVIELKRRNDGMWLGKLEGLREHAAHSFVLALKSSQDYDSTAKRLPSLAKIANFSQISKLIDHAIPGAQISYLARPPAKIPLHVDWVYFSIHNDNRYWLDILKSKCVAFYAGPPFDGEDAQVRIYSTERQAKAQLRLA